MSGSLIRLFLVDGNPKGLRTVEISNMTIYTTIFPRTKLKEFLERNESKKPGCYILLGNNIENPDKLMVYVGEGESVDLRLKSHSRGGKQKDFWDEAIVFTSKDDYITKTQIQYLESEIHKLITQADKAELENNQIPSTPNLSEVDTAEMKHFLSAIRLIMSSVGIDILEPKRIESMAKKESEEDVIYEFGVYNAQAQMKIEDDKYIVLKGSTAVIEDRPSALPAIKKMRSSLVESGVLKEMSHEGLYEFTDDYIFNSPSYAAAAIAGGTENGRRQWKHNGKSLNEMELRELE
ncbi:GIY-YIG nuclease family protein [Amphibacillus indicireducens]|uniref:GIY-YIG nuclease family protein n=1 Tax=Amphibacillus indicireducens TaxID=1076330 RepID=A0ABP7V457_9BACI